MGDDLVSTGMSTSRPIVTGVALAIAAAVAFGFTTPLVGRFGAGVGPFATASLLYLGAAAIALLTRVLSRPGREARVERSHLPRIALVAIAGAVVAPTALAWGLQHADRARASLLLNLEAVFTVILARVVFHETIGARIGLAVLLMVAAGSTAIVSGSDGVGATHGAWGLAAVAFASLAWAADNTWTRPLAEVDPTSVVACKAGLGAVLAGVMALGLRERWPAARETVALLACGATGYGVSLRLYLLAQRRIGAARTGSVFAIAPFLGALGAWTLGDAHPDSASAASGALFVAAVYLHLSERHAHAHVHEALVHEHAHRHDDGHHEHAHDGGIDGLDGSHSHVHAHDETSHSHEHAPDVHHPHTH